MISSNDLEIFINPPRWQHDIVISEPKGWGDKPIELREYCPNCGHPYIPGKKCIYCHYKENK